MAAALPPSRAFTSSLTTACRLRLLPRTTTAAFSSTSHPSADSPSSSDPLAGLGALSTSINATNNRRNRPAFTSTPPPPPPSTGARSSFMDILDSAPGDPTSLLNDQYGRNMNARAEAKPHRMHVLATKHNTHITLVQPPRSAAATLTSSVSSTTASAAQQKKVVDVLLSLSAGNIGFRKAGRGSYDAAYQLAAFVLKQIQEKGMGREIQKLEVVLRGFGAGREAVTKALLGSEGRAVRGRICAVVDATRLKLGGPRSRKPRRLG